MRVLLFIFQLAQFAAANTACSVSAGALSYVRGISALEEYTDASRSA